ncbi:dihydrofolate reductase family protein [Nocardioides lentus]|uniref:Dihydrofolate reductase family protein n=1 Tax=Nocardioides lentus TaxID=338077 RepID=A0ABP5A8V9_9ACTN
MRSLIESTFVTLDGVVSDPHVWGSPYWDDEHAAYGARLDDRADALLLGRETFEGFAEVWPSMAGDPGADAMNARPKHVASRTGGDFSGWNGAWLGEDTAAGVRALKAAEGGDLLKFGTGELDATLIGEGLLDELHLWLFPCVAGAGDRLLDGVLPGTDGATHLTVSDRVPFASGITVLVLTPRA